VPLGSGICVCVCVCVCVPECILFVSFYRPYSKSFRNIKLEHTSLLLFILVRHINQCYRISLITPSSVDIQIYFSVTLDGVI
jgi:hypothetical protein